jgi:hypothetical protein
MGGRECRKSATMATPLGLVGTDEASEQFARAATMGMRLMITLPGDVLRVGAE